MFFNTKKKIVSKLLEAAILFGLPDKDASNARGLIENFEEYLGFDTIITQLYEYDIKVNKDFYTFTCYVGEKLGVSHAEYSDIEKLVNEDNVFPKHINDSLLAITDRYV